MKDGSVYAGSFVNNEIEGMGSRFYASLEKEYEGNFRMGEPHGEGVMKYKNGCRYEGQWKEGHFKGVAFVQVYFCIFDWRQST